MINSAFPVRVDGETLLLIPFRLEMKSFPSAEIPPCVPDLHFQIQGFLPVFPHYDTHVKRGIPVGIRKNAVS